MRELRKIGVHVIDTSKTGDGFPDMVCFYRGYTTLAEIKNGKHGPVQKQLSRDQINFHDQAIAAGVVIPIWNTAGEALKYFGANLSQDAL